VWMDNIGVEREKWSVLVLVMQMKSKDSGLDHVVSCLSFPLPSSLPPSFPPSSLHLPYSYPCTCCQQ